MTGLHFPYFRLQESFPVPKGTDCPVFTDEALGPLGPGPRARAHAPGPGAQGPKLEAWSLSFGHRAPSPGTPGSRPWGPGLRLGLWSQGSWLRFNADLLKYQGLRLQYQARLLENQASLLKTRMVEIYWGE